MRTLCFSDLLDLKSRRLFAKNSKGKCLEKGVAKFAEKHGKKVAGNSNVWNKKEKQSNAQQKGEGGVSEGKLCFSKTI